MLEFYIGLLMNFVPTMERIQSQAQMVRQERNSSPKSFFASSNEVILKESSKILPLPDEVHERVAGKPSKLAGKAPNQTAAERLDSKERASLESDKPWIQDMTRQFEEVLGKKREIMKSQSQLSASDSEGQSLPSQ